MVKGVPKSAEKFALMPSAAGFGDDGLEAGEDFPPASLSTNHECACVLVADKPCSGSLNLVNESYEEEQK